MDTPTIARLARQAHALELLQMQVTRLQAENDALRAALTACEAHGKPSGIVIDCGRAEVGYHATVYADRFIKEGTTIYVTNLRGAA